MKNVFLALFIFSVVQSASAFQFREYDFKQVNCLGSNGVTYEIKDDPRGNLLVETALMGTKKTFDGNFYISTWTKDLVIEMGSESAYVTEYQLVIPAAGIKMGVMRSVGTAWKTVYASRYYLGTVTCTFEMNQ